MASIATSLSIRNIRALTPSLANRMRRKPLTVRTLGSFNGQHELLELFTRYPSRQRDGVEAARQLNVAIDRLPSFHDPKTNQRQFQFVAQVAQRVEDDALFAPGRRENVMDLVQNQHLDPEVAQKADGGPLELDDCGARVLRR